MGRCNQPTKISPTRPAHCNRVAAQRAATAAPALPPAVLPSFALSAGRIIPAFKPSLTSAPLRGSHLPQTTRKACRGLVVLAAGACAQQHSFCSQS